MREGELEKPDEPVALVASEMKRHGCLDGSNRLEGPEPFVRLNHV